MAKCKDCVHNEVCPVPHLKDASVCKQFKDRTNYVEVVHAHWEDGYAMDNQGNITYRSIDCSNCQGVFKAKSRAEVEPWKERFKVCPFCGALMDGGNEDG